MRKRGVTNQVLCAIAATGLAKSGYDYLTLPPPAEDLARQPDYLSSNPLTAPKPYANLLLNPSEYLSNFLASCPLLPSA
jgi:hypothetical protein